MTQEGVLNRIPKIFWDGGHTNTTGGLKLMRERIFSPAGGDRTSINDLCILITDGKATYDVGTTAAAAAVANLLI